MTDVEPYSDMHKICL